LVFYSPGFSKRSCVYVGSSNAVNESSVSTAASGGASHSILSSEKGSNQALVVANAQAQGSIQTYKSLVESLKPFANALVVAAGKLTSEALSDIMGPVWDEFQGIGRCGILKFIFNDFPKDNLQGNHTKVDTQISTPVTYVIKGTNLTALVKY